MTKSYRDKETKKVVCSRYSRRLPQEIQHRCGIHYRLFSVANLLCQQGARGFDDFVLNMK